ncbi:S49 family peptidase [Mesoterricola silvestris]|uniref:Phage capsid protein n=1 Tax=Mesoterricola silvestris TaxID=2927979 RepID=A0AA48GRJ1_9BACT|nr:S49 family peptidase [Mesoterricola silvestris]BDU72915.1 phage capsid protein [Mesoterricola silvestris]
MKILDIILAPWAIRPASLLEIRDLYQAHTRREKLDFKAWEAATGRPLGSESQPYQVDQGVAIVDVVGVLTKSPSMWNRLCGMSSMSEIGQVFQMALADPGVHSILLHVDSPGGTVDGTQELADQIFAARGIKPVVALADGTMCSAAYWVGSAADKVYSGSNTTAVGSIGVVATHVDVSGQQAKDGVTTTEITAGKYKRIATNYAPLSQEGRATIQAEVDYIYSVFVDSIATFRGVSVDTVLKDMADGRVFLGQQAVDAGLVDGVSTMGVLIDELNQQQMDQKAGAGAALDQPQPKSRSQEEPMKITREELEAQAPELIEALKAEGHKEGVEAGASAERSRIQGVQDQALPGHEALIATLAFDGKTTPGEAAMAVNAAEKAKRTTNLEKIRSEAPKPVDDGGDRGAGNEAKTNQEKWDADENLRSEFNGNFAAFESFQKGMARGNIRIKTGN